MDIMHAIADIERKAREIVGAADELRQNKDEILALKIRKKEEEMQKKLAERCEEIRRVNELECKECLAALEDKYTARTEMLKKKCADGKDEWTEKLFNAVVGGD